MLESLGGGAAHRGVRMRKHGHQLARNAGNGSTQTQECSAHVRHNTDGFMPAGMAKRRGVCETKVKTRQCECIVVLSYIPYAYVGK